MQLRSERVLLWAGSFTWLAVSAFALARPGLSLGARLVERLRGSLALTYALESAALLCAGAAFVWVLGIGGSSAARLRVLKVLGPAAFAATFIEQDLGYLMALSLPFALPWRPALLLLCGHSASIIGWSLFLVHDHPDLQRLGPGLYWLIATDLAYDVGFRVLAFAVGLVAVTEQARREQLARVNQQLLEAQGLLKERARSDERLDIARELHDSLGHHLAALNVQLELAQHLSTGPVRDAVSRARAVGRMLLGEVREVVSDFRTELVSDLPAALERLVENVSAPEIELRITPGLAVADLRVARAVYRSAQEFVTNSVRHARAQRVWLELTACEGGVCLSARDDGCGCVAVQPGNGLRGIEERARALGGSVHFSTRAGQGFALELRLPAGAA
jgi:signal transduction histidine kinase